MVGFMFSRMIRISLVILLALLAIGVGVNAKSPLPTKEPTKVQSKEDTPDHPAGPDTADTFKQLTLFSDVLERVRADYVDPQTDEKLIENALNGMLSALDPHSSYLNKKSFADMQTQTRGEFGGLGIEVTMDNGLVKVVSPIDDTPAAKAGLQSGDLITHIDGKPVVEITLADAVDLMRGAPNTKITLTIRRGGLSGQSFDVTLNRAIIQVKSVKYEAKGEVGYIRITAFNEQTQPGLDKAIDELNQKIGVAKVKGYVVDLRNNPGGLLEQAVSVSGSFLEAGKEVVSTRGRHKEENQSFTAKGGDKTAGKPIVVLINGGSASASEIVAGALQDHKRAVLLGIKSFGKGSVQTIIPVSGGGAMRLTTARYYTPSGRSIQALGIDPDIVVQPAKLEKISMGPGLHEADLKGALKNDTSTKPTNDNFDGEDEDKSAEAPTDKKADKNAKADVPFDYQLARAVDIINGVSIFMKKGG
jgi:carboxyl-terminal processing protease